MIGCNKLISCDLQGTDKWLDHVNSLKLSLLAEE
jgi:hypothetical protein